MNKKQEKSIARTKEEVVTNKVLVSFAAACAGILILMLFYRLLNYSHLIKYYRVTFAVMYVLIGLGALGVLLGIRKAFLDGKKPSQGKARAITGRWIAAVSGVLSVSFVMIRLFGSEAISILYIVMPAICVLYLVFLIYQAEFFVISLTSAAGGFFVWILNRILAEGRTPMSVASAVVMLLFFTATAILCRISSGNKGILNLFGRKIQMMPRNSRYVFIFLSCGLSALCVAAALIFGSAVAFYSMFVIFGFLFIMTVYYTVKLM